MRNQENVVFINGRRNGYNVSQCGGSMTVRELIEYLEQFDENMEVYLNNDNGYTYGSITESDIYESETEED